MAHATHQQLDAPARQHQVPEIHNPNDDWTGITDPAIRRKLQNRLNQRAYRERRGARALTTNILEKYTNDTYNVAYPPLPAQTQGIQAQAHSSPHICRISALDHAKCTFAPPNIHHLMLHFEAYAMGSYLTGSPRIDHRLTLSRLNVLRAAYQNVVATGMAADWLCSDEAVSIFTIQGPPQPNSFAVPESLRPTALQLVKPHHPWLDIFPFPRMRDNLILAEDGLDDDELCHDLTGFWDTRRSGATLLVWGDPWDPRNWEVTEEFARKWAWVLEGCSEIFAYSNVWRAQRGEKPLRWVLGASG